MAPALTESNVRHLLRRTECADRPNRVAHLMSLGSIDAAVADVMAVPANPPSASFAGIDRRYYQGVRLTEHWMDRMAFIERPFGERMALFWHGHICSEIGKTKFGRAMQEQIDLFRRRGLGANDPSSGNVSELMITMATQVAMLRYLDNDRNIASSPNQNFARELLELFVLGVGNYTEADVEAATAAWTGHIRPAFEIDAYVFDADQHDARPQTFLGKVINSGARPLEAAGRETIEVMLGTGPLGSGTVPPGAAANVGRPTREVAAEFLTRKLWQEFADAQSATLPVDVHAAMTAALLTNGFDIRPWVRAMLTHDDFYGAAAKSGLVRQPVDYVVALIAATGVGTQRADVLGSMSDAGQRPLYPPNVSGWRPNAYWVNASAVGARQQIVQRFVAALADESGTWAGASGFIDLPGGRLQRAWLESAANSNGDVVDELLRLTGLVGFSNDTRGRIRAHLDDPRVDRTMRLDALLLALSAPEMHVA